MQMLQPIVQIKKTKKTTQKSFAMTLMHDYNTKV